MKYLLLFCLLALSRAIPSPQDDVSLDDIEDLVADVERYGVDEGEIDTDTIKDIFGDQVDIERPYEIDPDDRDDEQEDLTCDFKNETKISIDDQFKNCEDYADVGYRCTPYYSCLDGEIITDGGGLFNPRFGGLSDVELNPDTSKCPGDIEMCCRLPEYADVPVEEIIKIHAPPRDCVVPPEKITYVDCEEQGYQCIKSDQCTDPISEIIDIAEIGERLGNTIDGNVEYFCPSLSNGDTQVCCKHDLQPKTSSTTQSTTVTTTTTTTVTTTDVKPVTKAPITIKPCSDYAKDNYVCLDFETCSNFHPDGIDGSGVLDIFNPRSSVKQAVISASCNNPGDTCCKLPFDPNENKQPIYKPKCGRRNDLGVGVRIHSKNPNESKTQFGEWPHMCALLNVLKVGEIETFNFVAGASLIGPNVLLTTGHNVLSVGTNFENLVVRCGEWDTQTENEPLKHQDRKVAKVIIHPLYQDERKNFHYNYAVLMLEEPFELDNHIDTVCLPDLYRQVHTGEDCFVTGWGKDKFGRKGIYQVILKGIKLDMVDHDTCEERLRTTRVGKRFNLHESINCAGAEEGKDACTGDGGGPLVCPDEQGTYYQTGIVSHGIDCGLEGIPGLYANVSYGLCFIDWANKCHFGDNAYDLGINGQVCKRWAKQEYCRLKDRVEELNYLIDQTTDLRKKSKLFFERRTAAPQIPLLENAIKSCEYGPQDIDCNNFDFLPDVQDSLIEGRESPEYDDYVDVELGIKQNRKDDYESIAVKNVQS